MKVKIKGNPYSWLRNKINEIEEFDIVDYNNVKLLHNNEDGIYSKEFGFHIENNKTSEIEKLISGYEKIEYIKIDNKYIYKQPITELGEYDIHINSLDYDSGLVHNNIPCTYINIIIETEIKQILN